MILPKDFFLISDTHFGHKRIIEYENRPENHEEVMINNWNNLVHKQDAIIHLGDLHLTNFAKAQVFCNKLQGRKYLIRGNHDHMSEKQYNMLGFEVIEPIYLEREMLRFIFTHVPVAIDQELMLQMNLWNIHGHLHFKGHPEFHRHGRHINLSVEMINYTPVRFSEILETLKKGEIYGQIK